MAERVIAPLEHPEAVAPTPEEIAAGLAQAETFLRDVAPHLGRLFGMDLNIQVGKAWATDMEGESNTVTADPRFFIERGYTPDMSSYATLHEVAAHLREKVTEPRHTERVINFVKPQDPSLPYKPIAERPVDPTRATFYNILADISGNNLIHAVLPRMKTTAEQLYHQKLFPDDAQKLETGEAERYIDLPRHLQFLYKIIREEMIPDSSTTVLPEVDEAIDAFRNYENQGDLIKYSTAVAKSARVAMGADERFEIWTRIIYPEYEKLVEQDRDDPTRQDQDSDQGDESGDGEQGNNPADSSEQSQQPQNGSPSGDAGKKTDGQRFGSYYQDYKDNRHPDPISDEDMDKFQEQAKQQAQAAAQPTSHNAIEREHERQLEEKVQAETGHSLRDQRRYNAEIVKWQPTIQEMRDVFQQIINERVAQKRGLSRRTFAEGAVLDPDRLVQTVIDVRNNVEEPEAFRDYEPKRGETTAIGKTDYVFLFDTSGSMQGEKARAAAASAVIGLEGLAALQRDVEEAEASYKIDLELDIRTAIYAFGDEAYCLKPLSTKVSPKERLDTYAAVANPSSMTTQDFLALEEIEKLNVETDRRKVLIVVSDGESDNTPRARRSIDRLRGQGWFVYGISIGSDEAEHLYKPTSRRVDDPSKLPETIHSFIEATIS